MTAYDASSGNASEAIPDGDGVWAAATAVSAGFRATLSKSSVSKTLYLTSAGTSSSVSAGRTGSHLINYRLGMVLEVATAAGSLLGGITAQYMDPRILERTFAIVTVAVALTTLTRLNRRNTIAGAEVDCGELGGHYVDHGSHGMVSYRVKRVPLAIVASFVAGNVSSLLGIGGGSPSNSAPAWRTSPAPSTATRHLPKR